MNFEFKHINGKSKEITGVQGGMSLMTRNNMFQEPVVLYNKGKQIATTYYRLKDRPKMKWRKWPDFQARLRRNVWYEIVYQAEVQ